MSEDKSLAQQYYEIVEGLKTDGVSNADAIRQVAEQFGKNENAVRGGIHQYKQKLNGAGTTSGTRSRGSKKVGSVEDLVASAREQLGRARDLIDQEVAQAKAALDNAQARYDEVAAGAEERKAKLETQIAALGE